MCRSDDWERFELPGEGGDRIPLSPALLKRIVRDDQRHVMALIQVLRRVGQKIFILESPRPFRHSRAAEHCGASRLALIDGAYRRLMREWFHSEDLPVVDAPCETYDDEGLTLESYRYKLRDQHHANEEFGALQVQAMATRSLSVDSDA